MEAQVESAIEIAFDPTTNQSLKAQAYDYLVQLRQDPNGWRVSLALFVREPSPSEVVRHVSMDVVNNAISSRTLSQQDLVHSKTVCMQYIRDQYTGQSRKSDSASIQNKLAQTMTYLFIALYDSEWTSFFDDLQSLWKGSNGVFNSHALTFYLRVLSSVHDEIADVLIPRGQDEHKRCTDIRPRGHHLP